MSEIKYKIKQIDSIYFVEILINGLWTKLWSIGDKLAMKYNRPEFRYSYNTIDLAKSELATFYQLLQLNQGEINVTTEDKNVLEIETGNLTDIFVIEKL